MSHVELPEHVRRFLVERIDSVPALEALLMLAGDARDWGVDEVAARTYVSEATARLVLDGLVRRRLIVHAEPRRYLFAPADAGDNELVADVAVAYQSHLIPMATLIHSKASASVQAFASAFEFKKEP